MSVENQNTIFEIYRKTLFERLEISVKKPNPFWDIKKHVQLRNENQNFCAKSNSSFEK